MSQNVSVASTAALPHVVVVGGGFGGVAAAKGLNNVPVRVTLVDKTNYHLFQPLLYQVATGMLEPGTITSPIRSLFRGQKNVDVRMAEVTGVDKDRRLVRLDDGTESIAYDYLVLATGVHGSYFGHDEWAPFAPSMKTLADAEFLRRRIIGALEQADRADDLKLREQLLTFVLVGAGPTGCELSGELAEHFRRVPENTATSTLDRRASSLSKLVPAHWQPSRRSFRQARSRNSVHLAWTSGSGRPSNTWMLTVLLSPENASRPATCYGPRVWPHRRRPLAGCRDRSPGSGRRWARPHGGRLSRDLRRR